MAEHGNLDQDVARLLDQVRDAPAFTADDQDDRVRQGAVEIVRLAVHIGADDPETALLELLQGLGDVADLHEGMYSTAPADVLPTVSLMSAVRRLGRRTASTPAHSAVRMMAPMLWTSSMPSRRTRNGTFPFHQQR